MNDLPNVLESCSVTLYADDTVLYFSSKLISEIETKMNSDLRLVCDWLKLNQLTLNIKKSQFMLIGSNSRLRRGYVGSIPLLFQPMESNLRKHNAFLT